MHALALCCYDHAITFSEEVKYVWQGRKSGASVLFVLNRYAFLIASLASMVQVVPMDVQTEGPEVMVSVSSPVMRLSNTYTILVTDVRTVFLYTCVRVADHSQAVPYF